MKKAVEFSENTTVNLLKYSKSIMKSVISTLNSLMSMVIKSKSPTAQTLKTSLSIMLVSASTIYAGVKAKEFITLKTGEESSLESSLEEQQTEEQADEEPQAEEQIIISSEDTYEQCKTNTLPSFINISMGWGGSNYMAALPGFKPLSPPSVIITAAGNAANNLIPRPYIDENKKRGSKEFDAILVGSIDPYGNRSGFSQKGEEVAIMAPSDYTISTVNNDGEYKRFSGTSGATPLVTGGLAGFSWLSGYQPTGEEAKILLEKTAIPLRLSNENPRMNSAGMLNAYKLGMVGKKLKELCGTDVYCFKNNIQKDSTYQFPEDTDVFELVESAFPQCSADKCLETSNICTDKVTTFERLRKAAFLNPSNKEYWRYLSCIYASNGFQENAKGIQSIYNGLLGAPPAETIDDRLATYTDKSCQVDEDCVLVPECRYAGGKAYHNYKGYYPNEIFFAPANKNFVTECQGTVLCEGACRCDSQKRERKSVKYIRNEDGRVTQTLFPTVRLRCVNSQCIEEEFQPDQPDQPEGGTGQR